MAYLDLSNPNQHCPSNWTLSPPPIRGCGRSSNGQLTCDSVFYPVHGRTYSSVCGRVHAYQEGLANGFGAALDDNRMDTYRRSLYIWYILYRPMDQLGQDSTFGALLQHWLSKFPILLEFTTVHVPTLIFPCPINFPPL